LLRANSWSPGSGLPTYGSTRNSSSKITPSFDREREDLAEPRGQIANAIGQAAHQIDIAGDALRDPRTDRHPAAKRIGVGIARTCEAPQQGLEHALAHASGQ
jgi:hypothetical protein